MVIIDTVINTLLGGLTLDPAGMHCPSWDDAFVSSIVPQRSHNHSSQSLGKYCNLDTTTKRQNTMKTNRALINRARPRPGLVALYDIRPGNREGQFLEPRSPHGAVVAVTFVEVGCGSRL